MDTRRLILVITTLIVCTLIVLINMGPETVTSSGNNSSIDVQDEGISSYKEVVERRAEINENSEVQSAAQQIIDQVRGNNATKATEDLLEESQKPALYGKIIVIDAGHQGQGSNQQEQYSPLLTYTKARVASGTSGVRSGRPEYELTLEIAKKLKQVLEEYGAIVVLTRKEHDVDISNRERISLANELGADMYLSVHADGSENSEASGFSILVPSHVNNPFEDVVGRAQELGRYVNVEMITTLGSKSRGVVERDDLTGLNWAEVPAIYVETGFMTNPEEDILLQSPEYQEQICEGIAIGLVKYFEKYTDTDDTQESAE